ncbi:MAG: pre-peptidase C-terminal domain-containing protein [Planctomycetes bacterium]|nr:pre-peptidase C-terminal domain-containing protein [Planctomycetota bacterium]
MDLTLGGANLEGAKELWTSFPTASPPAATGGLTFRVDVPADAHPGVHAVRVLTDKGVSPLKLVLIDDLSSVASTNQNKSVGSAQEIQPPIAVDGHIDGLSLNYYKFRAEAGQRLAFEAVARRLGSPLDPMIRILDAGGREITWSDDEPGLMSDARLCHTFQAAGEYFVEVRDIQYRGGAGYSYRLRAGDFPCVTVPYPMGAKRGSEVTLSFAGSHTEGVEPLKLNIAADWAAPAMTVGVKRAGGNASGFVTLDIGDREEALETEPNDEAAQATRVQPGVNLNGRLEKGGDVDHFVFTATKDQKLTFAGVARRLGSPADLYLRLLNSGGAQVAVAEDTGLAEGVLNFTIPADGDYTLAVKDLVGRGGPEFAYRVEVRPQETGFTLEAAADALNVPAGGTLMVNVTATRNGYGGPIQLAAENLPAGVTATSTVIGPGRNDVGLTLTAAPDAAAGALSHVKIIGTAKIGEVDFKAAAAVGEQLNAANNGLPTAPQHLTHLTSLAVAPAAPFSVRVEPPQAVFGQQLTGKVKLIVTRPEGIDEEIALAITPDKTGLPPNVTAAVPPIPKGQNEVEIAFTGTDKAPLGEFSANIIATHKKGNATLSQPVPAVGLKLDVPFRLTLDPGAAKLAKGGTLAVTAKIERNPAFAAPVTVTLENLPAGVTAQPATIAADQTEVEIPLAAGQDAAAGAVNNLSIKGEATIDKAKFAGTSPAVTLTVE